MPGLVAQSVTQAVARRSLDGILDAWDQCRHWSIHEGTRLKAGKASMTYYWATFGHAWPERRKRSRRSQDHRVRKVVGSSPARDFLRLQVSVTSVKAVEDGCLLLFSDGMQHCTWVSMLVSWSIVQCMHLWIVLVSLQKYTRKKSYI